MKKCLNRFYLALTAVIVFVALSFETFAQAPQSVSYSAIVRDVKDNVVADETVGLKLSLLEGSETGKAVYVETQSAKTDANGRVKVNVGKGTKVNGDFSSINWGRAAFFIQVEIDPKGGTAYKQTVTTQLLNAPYAMIANVDDADSDPMNEIQKLRTSRRGDTLYLSKSNWVIVPGISRANIFSDIATVETKEAKDVMSETAVLSGNIIKDGGAEIEERGFVWGTTTTPTLDDNVVKSGKGKGAFSANLSDLKSSTRYYVRAYAKNEAGTSYGDATSFLTRAPIKLANITTYSAKEVTNVTAILGGNITTDGGGNILARGIVYGTTANPDLSSGKQLKDGSGKGAFNLDVSGLQSETKYYARAFATNEAGTNYGTQIVFTTEKTIFLPEVSTFNPIGVLEDGVSSGGSVTKDGGAPITARGVVYGTSKNPTLNDQFTKEGNGLGAFVSELKGLSSGTTYYIRAYATNKQGTAYGPEQSFKTLGVTPKEAPKTVKPVEEKPKIIKPIESTVKPTPKEEVKTVEKTTEPAKDEPASGELKIGDNHGGGIVAHIFKKGEAGFRAGEVHGLIVAPSDLGTAPWGCYNKMIGGTSTDLGKGAKNISSILKGCDQAGIAAKLAQEVDLGGYKDWYLPSLDELQLIYKNLHTKGLGSFKSGSYWSSSEFNASSAWGFGFN
jgi:hypothetical protein